MEGKRWREEEKCHLIPFLSLHTTQHTSFFTKKIKTKTKKNSKKQHHFRFHCSKPFSLSLSLARVRFLSLGHTFIAVATMNIFRLAGDMTHLLSILVLLLKIYATKSCSGHSSTNPNSSINFIFVFSP